VLLGTMQLRGQRNALGVEMGLMVKLSDDGLLHAGCSTSHRYEVECKYTQYIHYHSRPVWPRLDMASLAAVLNSM
jgi:hypothetical protein